MKKVFGILALVTFSLVIIISCEKQDNSVSDKSADEISLKSLEPDVTVKGTGEKEDYEKVIVEDLVKKEQCKWEVVSGIVEFYYQNEMVFAIDFGNGTCDGLATVSWLNEANILQSKVVNVWKLFKKNHYKDECFKLLYPHSYTMPDSTIITFLNETYWDTLKLWYTQNPTLQNNKYELNYPVSIKYFKDGSTKVINNENEMISAKKDCGY
jgi:hypothetical protein